MRIQIESLEDLQLAAKFKHSVICDFASLTAPAKPTPAAVAISWSGTRIASAIKTGLYVYRERTDGLHISCPVPF